MNTRKETVTTSCDSPFTSDLLNTPHNSIKSSPNVISVRNLSKKYQLYDSHIHRLKEALHPFRKKFHKEFWVLRDVSFEVKRGQCVGIIGQNGAGKSTLLQIIVGVLQLTTGSMEVNGRISALLELGTGFNMEFTGRENVFMQGYIMGMSRKEMEERFDQIADFAEIGDFIDQPVKTYSSGMFVRLAFATAINIDPEILIVDEALSVGDVRFQARCFDKIREIREKGVTILFVTHSTSTFQTLCDYGVLLDSGAVFAKGTPKDVSFVYYELQRTREHAYQERIKKSKEEEEKKTISSTEANTEKKSPTQEGEHRFGLHMAEIVDFKVYNHEDIETMSLETGKKFKVWMKIEFYDEVKNPAVGIMIRNTLGQNLLGIHSYHEKRMNLGEKIEGDVLCVTLESVMLLNPDNYTLNLGIADVETDYEYKSIDVRNNVAAISVYGKQVFYGLVDNPGKIIVENS